MSRAAGSRVDGSTPYASFLRHNREIAIALPTPDETFAAAETQLSHSALKRLENEGVIRRLSREYTDDNGNPYVRWRWETTAPAYEWVQEYFDDDRAECPGEDCHSTGVRCLESRERYACTNDQCSATFGPETAEELIDR